MMLNVRLQRFILLVLTILGFSLVSMAAIAEKSSKRADLAAGFLSRLLPGWTFAGNFDLEIEGPLGEPGPEKVTRIGLSFQDVQFSNPKGTAMGEGLEGTLLVRIEARGGGYGLGHASLTISEGEVLVDRYYLNLALQPLNVDLHGELSSGTLPPEKFRGALEWGDLIQASWTGQALDEAGETHVRLGAEIRFPAHDALYRLLAAGISTEEEPGVMVKGSSEMSVDVEAGGSMAALRGRLQVKDAGLSMPEKGIRVEGVSGEIPFDLRLNGMDRGEVFSGSPSGRGEIRIRRVGLPFSDWKNIRLPLRSRSNELALAEALVLPLFGGRIALKKLRLARILPFPPDLEAALEIQELDFATLSTTLTPFEFAGKLNGSFPRLIIRKDDFQIEGRVRMDLWDGYILLTDFMGEEMYSRQRRWGFDARLQDLSLEEATQSLEFGQMGGVLDGEIKGMVFSFGQPESFEFWLRNDPESGVKQYIDAKAVKSLSILSSGVQAPLLPFFKYYPYSELGIYCKLENDVFTLRGTIHKDEKEYLLKRGFLRGVNVINRNPNNRIPWRDMLQRIQRVIPEEGQEIKVRMGSEQENDQSREEKDAR